MKNRTFMRVGMVAVTLGLFTAVSPAANAAPVPPPSLNAEITSNSGEASSPQSGEASPAPNTEAKESEGAASTPGEANSGHSEDGNLVPLAAQLASPVQAPPAGDRDLTDEELKKFLEFDGPGDKTADLFKQGEGNYQIGAPLPGAKATGQVPAGLEAYYGQRFTGWQKCEDLIDPTSDPTEMFQTGECGYLITPIDYTNPAAGNTALFVYKHAAESGKSKGTIVFNNGGPGGEAAKYVAAGVTFDNPTFKALRKDYDLVGMDPRGVGHSFPFSQCVNNGTPSSPVRPSRKMWRRRPPKWTKKLVNMLPAVLVTPGGHLDSTRLSGNCS